MDGSTLIADQTLAAPGMRRAGPRGRWLQLFSPAGLEWNRFDLPILNLPPALVGLRIIHLTDLHFGPRWFKAYDDVLSRIAIDPPDLILLGGDLVEHKTDCTIALPTARRFLHALRARIGIFTILGNHDGDLLAPYLVSDRVKLIDGRVLTLTDSSTKTSIEILGVPGVRRESATAGFLNSLPPRKKNSLRIALTHYPDNLLAMRDSGVEVDLQFAGHTHGGQVCLPGSWPIIAHTELRREYASGIYRFDQTWLITGRGLGFATLPIRAFCPAEIIEVKLKMLEPQMNADERR